MWKDDNMLQKSYTEEPNEIQKAMDQIGYDAVVGVVRPHGNMRYCDMHGYYLATEVVEGVDHPANEDVCPLCISHNPEAEGTTATDMELYIDLKDAIESAVEPIDII